MIDPKAALVFVYNADSGLFSAATDFIKRIATPDKYECNLCMVTYGSVKMKSPWKDYLETIPNKKYFLHRDEFLKKFPEYSTIPLPVIFVQNDSNLDVLVSAEEINSTKNLPSMKKLLQDKIQNKIRE